MHNYDKLKEIKEGDIQNERQKRSAACPDRRRLCRLQSGKDIS